MVGSGKMNSLGLGVGKKQIKFLLIFWRSEAQMHRIGCEF